MDWFKTTEFIANIVTIIGLLTLIGSYIITKYRSHNPLKKVKFIVNQLSFQELVKTKRYLHEGENIFFACKFDTYFQDNTIIDELTLCVERGLSSFDYLYHLNTNDLIYFSFDNNNANASICNSDKEVDEKYRVDEFYVFDDIYIKKIKNDRDLIKAYIKRDNNLKKFRKAEKGYECYDEVPIYSPMLHLTITSRDVTSTYVVFAHLIESEIA